MVIGVGASLGARRAALALAVQALDADGQTAVRAVSRVYASAPLGPARHGFLNLAVRVETSHAPRGLLALCKRIEARLGRRPSARWADRVVDLDLLVVDGVRRRGAALVLPHPGLRVRSFALAPAAEVAPWMRLPGDGRRLADIPLPAGPCARPVGALTGPLPRLAAPRGLRYNPPSATSLPGQGCGRAPSIPSRPHRSPVMKFFLDTANVAEIKEAYSWGIIDGVTTNPSLIAREGRDFIEAIAEICEIVRGPVSAETVAPDAAGMIREGRLLAQVSEHVVVKVPLTVEGIKATRALADDGIDVNVTLCFSPVQALIAAKAGAAYISPFLGRVDDTAGDGMQLIEQIVQIFHNYPDLGTEVLAASIRGPLHVTQVAMAGADVATIPFNVMARLFHHPLTDLGNEKFLADWAKVPDNDVSARVQRWLEKQGR